MDLYFAPLEGITGYIYRNTHHKFFGGVEKYFTPFIAPTQNCVISPKELKDVCKENNQGIHVVPQILTNKSRHFIDAAKKLSELGYSEVNLNLGCPSGTVVAKKKGSGFLAETDLLEKFLEDIFEKTPCEISIKTRIGKTDKGEFCDLLEIFNRYPIKELIIHPRLQTDFYKGKPNMEIFSYAYEHSKIPLSYNGDICGVDSYRELVDKYPKLNSVMIGRGLVGNPYLCQSISHIDEDTEVKGIDLDRFREFHEALLAQYMEVLSGDRNVLFRMKELWFYMERLFPRSEKIIKKIKKANTVSEYNMVVNGLLE